MLCAFCNCASLMSYINPIRHGIRAFALLAKKCNKKDDILFDKFPFDVMLSCFLLMGIFVTKLTLTKRSIKQLIKIKQLNFVVLLMNYLILPQPIVR